MPATAFVSKNGFRNDDFAPYLYRTTDYGRTWTAIAANLPAAPINVVVQDRKNAGLLIVGNDLGVFVSIDGGATVGADEGEPADGRGARPDDPPARKRPRDRDLRSRAVDGRHHTAPGADGDVLDKAAHLFDVEPRARYGFSTQGMNYHLFGDKYLEVPNEPEALVVNYLLRDDAPAEAGITVSDHAGRIVREIRGPAKRGLNRALVPLGGRGGGRGGSPIVPLAVGEYVHTTRGRRDDADEARERAGTNSTGGSGVADPR